MRALSTFTNILGHALNRLGLAMDQRVVVEPPKDPRFGDLASNAALVLSKDAGMKPRDLAMKLAEQVKEISTEIAAVEVAGPGFLNVTFSPSFWQATVGEVLRDGPDYGRLTLGQGKRFQVEFVSANPTGPLHIGHGRGAAVGDALARVLDFAGYVVSREYYINDAGRQMRLLGSSIYARYRQIAEPDYAFPEDGYKGDYIKDLAVEARERFGDEALADSDKGTALCQEFGGTAILDGIKQDLRDFGVRHDVWFSESSLVDNGTVQRTLDSLKERGLAYEQDGALWFRTSDFGDDKDRVLRKSTGELTYFASDIAYHADKYARGFAYVTDVWGADHHGYIPRMRAAITAMGQPAEAFDVILVQLVNLLRGGEQVAMSTRAGEFETLADVVAEVGADAARFIFLSRKADSKLDFDLELVKRQTMDNPVYYVQYAHARIHSVFAKAAERGVALPNFREDLAALLTTSEELDLCKAMERFPDVVEASARTHSAHHVSGYLRELAGLLHRAYTANPILTAGNDELVAARLVLMRAVAAVLARGLDLLGVSAPERMAELAQEPGAQ